MADYRATSTEFTAVADAIRTKGGTSAQLTWPNGFVSAVQAIPTGSGVVQPLSVTQNGTYNPPSGVDGYAPVTVNVSGGGAVNVLSGTTAPQSSVGSNGDVYIQYSETPYAGALIGSNNPKIDTGILATNVYSAEFEFTPVSVAAAYQYYLSNYGDDFSIGQVGNLSGIFIRCRGIQIYSQGSVLNSGKNTIKFFNGIVTLNGDQIATYSNGSPLGSNASNIYLYSYANGTRNCNAAVWGLKLYDQNGDLLFNGTPNNDNNPGIYDAISQTYLTATSGDFGFDTGVIIQNVYKKVTGEWVYWTP